MRMPLSTSIPRLPLHVSTRSVSDQWRLPFDAHNHVHMGPTWPLTMDDDDDNHNNPLPHLAGMAVMSTHPRDFPRVLELAAMSSAHPKAIVPCIGVHPWFLHELLDEDWQPTKTAATIPTDQEDSKLCPRWIAEMENLLMEYPNMPVGEIGLDGFHFDPVTKDLTTPLRIQIQALELQLDLAVRYQRPVSLHCVRAIGPLMDTIAKIQTLHQGKLPPSMYFHAFGGKAATVTQIVKTLEKNKKNASTRVYFGFAPVINFDSPKTLQVIQQVGLDRLVLETDHEDAALVAPSMAQGVKVIAQALGVSEEDLVQQTNQNVCALYNLSPILHQQQ